MYNLFIFFSLILSSGLISCEPPKGGIEGRKKTQGSDKETKTTQLTKTSIELKGTVDLDRDPTTGDANLRFETSKSASCLVQVATQVQKDSVVKTADCETAQNQTKFHVVVTGLDLKEKYMFTLLVWPEGGQKKSGRRYVLKESTGLFSSFGGEEEEEKPQNEIIVSSYNVGLGVGSVFRQLLQETRSKKDLEEMLTPRLGCQFGPPPNPTFTKPEEFPRISGVVTRGFASGKGEASPHSNKKISIKSESEYQTGADWEWSFQYGDGSFKFRAPSASRFDSLQIESGEVRFIKDVFFEQSSRDHISTRDKKRLQIARGADLNLRWSTTDLNEGDHVNVQLGHGGMKNIVYCSFDAQVGLATIPASVIDRLVSGYHYVSINLETTRVYEFEKSVPRWAFRSTDTRSSIVYKQ